jgi:hypothetical protein
VFLQLQVQLWLGEFGVVWSPMDRLCVAVGPHGATLCGCGAQGPLAWTAALAGQAEQYLEDGLTGCK